ncbi:unnamed protein product [Taenia asiatica]|uniref:Vesicle transport protein USE1 n=1 Tax=Taenia asiatica TaxID=60517 RepID=A0A0R3WDV4_TAEAS|nr:unnamed protein product [Taenia asiatica]
MLEGSVLEANFVRLLHCTEILSVSDDLKCSEFPSYCRKLQELYGSLAKSSLRPAAEYLHIYKSRVSYTSYAWILIEIQPIDSRKDVHKLILMKRSNAEMILKKICANGCVMIPKQHVGACKIENPSSLLLVPLILLNVEGDAERKIKGKTSSLLDVEVLERDKIAEDMLYLTEELRSTQVALGDRIRADIDILSASSTVAQANIESLASVSWRVREELGHKFGLCIWVLFLLSVIVFFWMVLFIKFTPKG